MKTRSQGEAEISEDEDEIEKKDDSDNSIDEKKKEKKNPNIIRGEGTGHQKSLHGISGRPSIHPNQETRNYNYNKFRKYNYIVVLPAGVCLVAILLYQLYYFGDTKHPDLPPFNLRKELVNLKQLYPNQNLTFWSTLMACLSRMEEDHGNLCVLLMLHGHSDPGAFSKMLKDVGQVSGKFLKTYKSPVFVEGGYLEKVIGNNNRPGDYSDIVSYYNNSLNESKVFIVNGLESVPSQILKQFHSLCDEQNPVIGGISIFMTLKSDLLASGTPVKKVAEKTFSQLWSSIPSNELDPLVTRMTVNVAELKPNF